MTEVVLAARAEDWVDVEGIITRQTGRLDWSYIRAQLDPLAELKGAPEIMDELDGRRAEFERQRHAPKSKDWGTGIDCAQHCPLKPHRPRV